ncbi:MAG: hypothetical protein ACLVEJ_24920 [Parabacteroides sp.]
MSSKAVITTRAAGRHIPPDAGALKETPISWIMLSPEEWDDSDWPTCR